MIEDKLTKDERVRLESLSQSVAVSCSSISEEHPDRIVERARKFENYLKGEE